MTLVNVSLTVHLGFVASYECLLSNANDPSNVLENYLVPTGTGAPPPIVSGPTFTDAPEILSNEISVPLDFDPEDVASAQQLFHCLPSEDVISSHVAGFDNIQLLPPDNLERLKQLQISLKFDVQVFPYALEPNIVENAFSLRTYPWLPDYWIDPEAGSYTLTGYESNYLLTIFLPAAQGSFTLTGGESSPQLTVYTLQANSGLFYATEPGVLFKPICYMWYGGTYTWSNLLGTKNQYLNNTHVTMYNQYAVYFDEVLKRANRYGLDNESYIGSIGSYVRPDRYSAYDLRLFRKPGTDWGFQCQLYPYYNTTGVQVLLRIDGQGSQPTLLSTYGFTDLDHIAMVEGYLTASLSGYANTSSYVPIWRHPKRLELNTWYTMTYEVYQGRGNIAINGQFAPMDFPGVTPDFIKWRFGMGLDPSALKAYDGFACDWYWYFGSRRKHRDFTPPALNDLSDTYTAALNYTLPEPAKFTIT